MASTSWPWDFDSDGTIDAIDSDPTWTYAAPGTYSATLTVGDGVYLYRLDAVAQSPTRRMVLII